MQELIPQHTFKVVVPGCVCIHVVLQQVCSVPLVRREPDEVKRQVRHPFILWLVNPVVAKRSDLRREEAKQRRDPRGALLQHGAERHEVRRKNRPE